MQDPVELSSDLVTYAARLVRAVRREHHLPAGVRILSLLDEHGALGVSALAEVDRSSQPSMSRPMACCLQYSSNAVSLAILTRCGHSGTASYRVPGYMRMKLTRVTTAVRPRCA